MYVLVLFITLLMMFFKNLERLDRGDCIQDTMGLIGMPGLCSFGRPYILGGRALLIFNDLAVEGDI